MPPAAAALADGTVVIAAMARDPGYRTKIAVDSRDSKVDPVGACVGARGTRVRNIVKELNNEKIDIIRDETETQNGHRGIIVLSASKGCTFSNVLFQEITVHGDTLNLLAIDNLDQDTPWAQKIRNASLREIQLTLRRVTVTGTERGQWWTPFMDRRGQPMRSRLRTADSGRIEVLFDDVSINGVRLRSEKDFPHGLETEGEVVLTFR